MGGPYTIRVLMLKAVGHGGHDPDRISFSKALGIARHPSHDPQAPHCAGQPDAASCQ